MRSVRRASGLVQTAQWRREALRPGFLTVRDLAPGTRISDHHRVSWILGIGVGGVVVVVVAVWAWVSRERNV